ncbi:MAG: hypothetical protein SFW66_09105 [Gammaproteobacteria bacterium]|nr:hypothetical protein [Gammaproteobacteria bacterium]
MAVTTTLLLRKEIAKGIVLEKYTYSADGGSTTATITPDTTDAENYGIIRQILGYCVTDDDTADGCSAVYNNNQLSATLNLTFTANDAGTVTIYGLVS